MNAKVLFLDLDHTLIRPKSGDKFPKHYLDWEFIEETKNLIEQYYKNDYKIVIVTNQGGIKFGLVDEEELLVKFATIESKINAKMSFFYSKTNDKTDITRKPNIGMFKLAEEALGTIDLKNSIMVGDASGIEGRINTSDSDKMFAKNAGIGTYYDIEEFKRLWNQ